MLSVLAFPGSLQGLEQKIERIREQLGPRDELLLLPRSRSPRLRRGLTERVAATRSRRVRVLGAGDGGAPVKGRYVLVLDLDRPLRPDALGRLRAALGERPAACFRFAPAGDPPRAGRRLFGVPLALELDKPYLLRRDLCRALPLRGRLARLRDDHPDVLLAVELAGGGGWLAESLLYRQGRRRGPGLDRDEALDVARRLVRRRRLPVSVERTDQGITVSAARPRGIDIELTTRCNARCTFCPQGRVRRHGDMSDEVFARVLALLRENPIGTIYFIGRGEPLLHPRFVDYVRAIRDQTGVEFEVFTNGLTLRPRLVEQLAALNDPWLNITVNVSLHTLRPETHRQLTGTDLGRVSRNLDHLQRYTDRLRVTYAFVTNKINEPEMATLRRFLDRRGIRAWDVSLIYNKGGYVAEGPLFDRAFYERQLDGRVAEPTGPCWYSYSGRYYFVHWTGRFTLCHDDFEEDTLLGEVGRDPLEVVDARVSRLLAQGGAPRCRRCNKRLRERHHGGNVDPESRVRGRFVLQGDPGRPGSW